MDFRNKSIPVGNVTSFDVNKTIQRSLTKAIARHGLGISLYYSDFAVSEEDADVKKTEPVVMCESCGNPIKASHGLSSEKIVAGSMKSYGKKLCFDCAMKAKKEKEEQQ